MEQGVRFGQVLGLIGVYMVYACSSVFSKSAAMCPFMSAGYILNVCGVVLVLGLYAVLWQQVIKRMPISTAFMFKGTTLLFALLISFFLFGEPITWMNGVGAILIIGGITLFSMA